MRAKTAREQPLRSHAAIRFATLGIPVEIIADDSTLLSAAIANFAGLTGCIAGDDASIGICLHWNELATARVGFTVSVKGSCLTLEGQGLLGRADASSGRAECSLSRAYSADRDALAEIGETLLLFLLTRAGRAPIHAAAIRIGETAVLLAGPSGSGKSTLALAAQRQGLEVLSEDTSYIQIEPRLRIWGWPGSMHLLPADAPAGQYPRRIRGGREKMAIPRLPTRAFADRAALVALEHGLGLRLQRSRGSMLVSRLSPSEPGFSLLRPDIERAVRLLAQRGGWQLTLSDDADRAIALLRERFERR